jgi:hypothetical protein
LNKISEKLYEYKVPNDYENAAKILEGSFIQKSFSLSIKGKYIWVQVV